jgi:hypothetical protein
VTGAVYPDACKGRRPRDHRDVTATAFDEERARFDPGDQVGDLVGAAPDREDAVPAAADDHVGGAP